MNETEQILSGIQKEQDSRKNAINKSLSDDVQRPKVKSVEQARERLNENLEKGFITETEFDKAIETIDMMSKDGEGSKGGKVIGHTKSGKAIYENSSTTFKDFNSEDHSDAVSAHMKAAKEYSKKAKDTEDSATPADDIVKDHKEKSQYHSSMAELHSNAMNQKLDKESEKK